VRIIPTDLEGVHVIEVEPFADERGLFARTFDADVFRAAGLATNILQCSTSYNKTAFTLRGLHYQIGGQEEIKLVRCTRGRVFDVAVDVRPESRSYLRWTSSELSAVNRRSLYIPAGFAHGLLTLEPDSEVLYQIDTAHALSAARGLRWNDPALAIEWPGNPRVLSEWDASLPLVGAR